MFLDAKRACLHVSVNQKRKREKRPSQNEVFFTEIKPVSLVQILEKKASAMAGLSLDLLSIICRTCLMQKKIFPIDQVQLEEGTLMDLLQNVIFAEEQREGMPSNMCEECIQEAAVVFKFLVKCKSSNQILKEMLKTRDKSEDSTPEKKPEISKKLEKVEEGIFGIDPDLQPEDQNKENSGKTKNIDAIEENMKKIFGVEASNSNIEFEISFENPNSEKESGNLEKEACSSDKEGDGDVVKSGQVIHPNKEYFARNIRPRRNKNQLNNARRHSDADSKNDVVSEEEYQEIGENDIQEANKDDEKMDEDSEHVECKIETVNEPETLIEEQYEEICYADEGYPETYENEEYVEDEDKPEYFDHEEEHMEREEEEVEEDEKILVDPAYLKCPQDSEEIEQNINILEKTSSEPKQQHKMNYSKKMEPITEIENMCYCCSDCDAPFFTYEELLRHKVGQKHRSVQIFVCPECSNRYRRYSLFWEHIQGHMGERNYACEECNKSFVHKRDVQNHLKEVHLRTNEFECEECGKVFTRKSNLTTHLKIHAGTYRSVCPYCGEKVTPTTLWAHKKRHKKEQENGGPAYQCHECKKVVSTEETLRDHIARLHTPKTLECDICSKKCSNEKTLREHKDFVHQDGRFECRICGNIYKQKSILKDHIRNYHAGETAERYQCGVCQKEFNYKSSLRDHMRTHTGDPRFECKVCGKICLNNRQFKLHLQTHSKQKVAS